MREIFLGEMTDIIETIANIPNDRIKTEEKNCIVGRLITLNNLVERYLNKLDKINKICI